MWKEKEKRKKKKKKIQLRSGHRSCPVAPAADCMVVVRRAVQAVVLRAKCLDLGMAAELAAARV